MKKFILPLLATMTSAGMAEGKPFHGFYLGAEAGYTQRTVTNSILENSSGGGLPATPGFINTSAKNNINGFVYGLMAGYGQNMNGFYLGGEITAHMDTADKSARQNLNDFQGASWPFSSEYRRGLAFGIAPRFGIILAGTTMAYGKLGVEFSHDKTSLQNIGGTISSPPGTAAGTFPSSPMFTQTKTTASFVPGIGLERAFNNLLARIEYNYNCGAKVRQTGNFQQAAFSTSDNQTLKYTAHVVKVGLAYQF